MNQLLPELLGEIADRLNDDIIIFSLTCKLWYEISKPYLTSAYVKHFVKNVPIEMLEAFGGAKKIESYDILKIKTCDDYIEGLVQR